jgi:hypothetical protein
MQFHRLASLIIGIWLGISVFMDFVATQNFKNVPRVMSSIDIRAVENARKVGDMEALRHVLRYSAGEINRYLFEQWEWTELMLGLALFLVLLFAGTYQKAAMSLCILMMCIVASQRFYLTPRITLLGRQLEFGDAASNRFAAFHAAYGIVELSKIGLGLILAGFLLIRKRAGKRAFVREYERDQQARSA